ncbi:hypothetical protein [Streptomyces neyagawaensis]|uniref:hypothetical protein n=1 Tax=Streptomyces neyagawaensis TaxID=42238 RepID=UPI0012FF10B8|nr:hypothetical protein [Streptomyces neyagawaensis]MCL6733275.1 hypothetical protein [Streptomyces neyagawaensis]MDE1685077.1 hypothetical protein [Streptomyces neyagawaensis]
MTTGLRANAALVDALGSALREGEHGLKTGPALLVRVLSEESWRSFITQRGDRVQHQRFEEFVTAPPLKGLGASMDLVRKLIADNPGALDLLDRAVQQPLGINQHKEGLDNIQTLGAPSGTSKEAGLRRLRKDRPDLHAKVLAGHLTTHAAMVAAGFRKRTVSVPVTTPEDAARVLRRNLEPEEIQELARLLTEE